jgi:hypothetical protein
MWEWASRELNFNYSASVTQVQDMYVMALPGWM